MLRMSLMGALLGLWRQVMTPFVYGLSGMIRGLEPNMMALPSCLQRVWMLLMPSVTRTVLMLWPG